MINNHLIHMFPKSSNKEFMTEELERQVSSKFYNNTDLDCTVRCSCGCRDFKVNYIPTGYDGHFLKLFCTGCGASNVISGG